MSVEVIVFTEDDLGPVLAALGDGGWVNLQPEVDEAAAQEEQGSGFFAAFGARGPAVPFCTWLPAERSAGIQHATGPKLARRVDVPAGWRVVQDHPKRGLVVQVGRDVPSEDVLRWLLVTATGLCPFPLLGRWVAEVHS